MTQTLKQRIAKYLFKTKITFTNTIIIIEFDESKTLYIYGSPSPIYCKGFDRDNNDIY